MISLIKNNFKFVLLKALRIAFAISTFASIYEIAIGKILEGESSTLNTIVFAVLLTLYNGLRASIFIYQRYGLRSLVPSVIMREPPPIA